MKMQNNGTTCISLNICEARDNQILDKIFALDTALNFWHPDDCLRFSSLDIYLNSVDLKKDVKTWFEELNLEYLQDYSWSWRTFKNNDTFGYTTTCNFWFKSAKHALAFRLTWL